VDVNALGLLVRQAGYGRVELLIGDFALVYLAGGQGHEHDVILDAVVPAKGEIGFVPVCTQEIGRLL
jgi:hypothetical protein